jgi:hypothetical protein
LLWRLRRWKRAGSCLRRARSRASLRKFQREPPEDGQVSVKPDALNAPNAEHRQPVVMLQPPKLALDGGAATVEPLPLVGL